MNFEPTEQPTAETKAKRRTWKKIEEDALIRCMRNEYSDKWSADNSFKAGFFTLIEKELTKLLPNTDIRANPHIDSKVKYWKTIYNLITDILRVSGFSWSDVNKCIVVDEASVWEDYEKAHKKVKGFNGRAFPYYDDWCVLFGKDRATGELAEDPTQMAENQIPIDLEADPIATTNYYIPHFDDQFGGGPCHSPTSPSSIPQTSVPPPSTPQNTPTANAGAKKGKKRSRLSDEASLQESMEKWMKESARHMGEMANKMGYSKELAALRKSVPTELGKLNLTLTDKYKACAIISQAEERVDTFFGTPDEEKQAWVELVLSGLLYPLTNG